MKEEDGVIWSEQKKNPERSTNPPGDKSGGTERNKPAKIEKPGVEMWDWDFLGI